MILLRLLTPAGRVNAPVVRSPAAIHNSGSCTSALLWCNGVLFIVGVRFCRRCDCVSRAVAVERLCVGVCGEFFFEDGVEVLLSLMYNNIVLCILQEK